MFRPIIYGTQVSIIASWKLHGSNTATKNIGDKKGGSRGDGGREASYQRDQRTKKTSKSSPVVTTLQLNPEQQGAMYVRVCAKPPPCT